MKLTSFLSLFLVALVLVAQLAHAQVADPLDPDADDPVDDGIDDEEEDLPKLRTRVKFDSDNCRIKLQFKDGITKDKDWIEVRQGHLQEIDATGEPVGDELEIDDCEWTVTQRDEFSYLAQATITDEDDATKQIIITAIVSEVDTDYDFGSGSTFIPAGIVEYAAEIKWGFESADNKLQFVFEVRDDLLEAPEEKDLEEDDEDDGDDGVALSAPMQLQDEDDEDYEADKGKVFIFTRGQLVLPQHFFIDKGNNAEGSPVYNAVADADPAVNEVYSLTDIVSTEYKNKKKILTLTIPNFTTSVLIDPGIDINSAAGLAPSMLMVALLALTRFAFSS